MDTWIINQPYEPRSCVHAFHNSDSFYRVLHGDPGAGKTYACCVEVALRCCGQYAHEGVRRSRWAVICPSHHALRNTMRVWSQAVPSHPAKHRDIPTVAMRFALEDLSRVEADIMFLVISDRTDVYKILSLECSGFFLSEMHGMTANDLDRINVPCRVSRYPSSREGNKHCWHGVVADCQIADFNHHPHCKDIFIIGDIP